MDFLYRFRQFLSGPPAIIVMVLIVTTPFTKVLEKLAPKELFEIPIDLNEPPPPPPPPPPQLKVETPPEPKDIAPTPPVPDVITKDSIVTEVKPATPVPPGPPVAAPTVAPPAPAAPRVDVGAIQANYQSILRGYLESIKRYPTSREARSQRPTGTVTIWIELRRDGSLINTGIGKSSDSIILDNAALATARQGKFPAFPNEAFAGQSEVRFNVSLEYNIQQEN